MINLWGVWILLSIAVFCRRQYCSYTVKKIGQKIGFPTGCFRFWKSTSSQCCISCRIIQVTCSRTTCNSCFLLTIKSIELVECFQKVFFAKRMAYLHVFELSIIVCSKNVEKVKNFRHLNEFVMLPVKKNSSEF